MKKVLAIFLSALLICISIAPMSLAVAGPQLTTRVIEGDYSDSAGQVASVTTTTFTVVLKAPKGIKNLVGVNLYFDFDPAVLSVAKAGLAGSTNDKGVVSSPNFNGLYVTGLKADTDNQYTMAWIPSVDAGVSKNQAKDLVYITFNVLDTTKTQTSLNLYVDEFRTDDGNDENDITKTVLLENRIVNFTFPDDTPPATTVPETEAEDETSASDINKLLQIIRDMLSGNGVTFADFADAIANMLGNAELTDIIEQLVDGNVDISDLFQEILSGLGLDFGSFEDILNMIIDFIMGLFGGDEGGEDTSATSSAVITTAASSDSASTTAAGSSTGSEKTGDMGVALAATVCVAASAAFVLTRKKKEIL